MRWFALLILLLIAPRVSAAEPLPSGATLRLGDSRFRAPGEIRRLRFSEDGRSLLGWVRGSDGNLHPVAWNAKTGDPVVAPADRTCPDRRDRSTSAARLDQNRVLTAGPGGVARVWDGTTGRQLAVLTGHTRPVTAVAATSDGKWLATGSMDGLVRIWNSETFHPLNTVDGHVGQIRTVRVSADGSRAVTTGDDGAARIWDLSSGKELRAFPTTGLVELSRNGTSIVVQADGIPVTRDVLTGLELIPDRPPTSPSPSLTEFLARIDVVVALSPDGRTLAVANRDGTIELFELATGQRRRLLVGHPMAINAMTFAPDGRQLLTASVDHTVLVWGVAIQDVPLPDAIRRETQAAKLWTTVTTGSAAAANVAMARLAVEPPVAVKMARLRLRPAEQSTSDLRERLADLRAIELLESLRTLEALEFLEELAAGNPEAYRTREATRALERLR